MADLNEVMRKALLFLDFKGKTIVLKAEQEKALYRFNSHIPLLSLSISKMVSANVDRAIQRALHFLATRSAIYCSYIPDLKKDILYNVMVMIGRWYDKNANDG